MIKTGEKAPGFILRDEQEREVKLSDFSGKWVVLYFYPKDNTPGCTTEALEFTALNDAFNEQNAVILGISGDSCQSHQKFVVRHHLGIRLLADTDKKVLETYGAWGQKKLYGRTFLGITRSTVLIDPKGIVAWHWPKVKAKGHSAAVLEKLKDLNS